MSTLSRSKTIALLLLILICFSVETANACSPAPVVVEITCDGKHDFLPYTNLRSGETWTLDPIKLASVGKATCGSEIPSTDPRIAKIVAEYGQNHTYFNTRNLEFTPYRPDVITRLQEQNLNLLTCRTNFIEVVQNWIVHYEHRPEYCGSEPFSFTLCGSTDRIMLFPFLYFLVTNPTPITGLYIGTILLITAICGWLLWRQRSFFKPSVGKAFLFLLVCPSLLYLTVENGFSLDIGTLGWAAMVWILVSAVARLLGYLKTLFRVRETPV